MSESASRLVRVVPLDEVKTECEMLRSQLAEKRAESQQQAVELAQLRERIVAGEKAAQAAAEAHAEEIRRLAAQLDEERASHRQALDEVRQELKAAGSTLEGLRTELSKREKRRAVAEAKATAAAKAAAAAKAKEVTR